MSHRLWWQLRGFSRGDSAAFRSLDRAWDIAADNLGGASMRTPEDLRASAIENAHLWSDRLLAGTDGLTDTEILGDGLRRQRDRAPGGVQGHLPDACGGREWT